MPVPASGIIMAPRACSGTRDFFGVLWLFRRPVATDYFGSEATALQLRFSFKKRAQRCLPVIFFFVGYGFVG